VDLIGVKRVTESLSDFTFAYTTFHKEDKRYVEEYIEGIGGNIIE